MNLLIKKIKYKIYYLFLIVKIPFCILNNYKHLKIDTFYLLLIVITILTLFLFSRNPENIKGIVIK